MSRKIRVRERFNASPKPGMRQSWTEYQVVSGRKILDRFETLYEARKKYPDALFPEREALILERMRSRRAAP